jgi:hypothetical protein
MGMPFIAILQLPTKPLAVASAVVVVVVDGLVEAQAEAGGSLSRGSSSPVSWLGGGAEGHFRTSRKKPKPGFFFSQSHSQINPHQHSRTSSSASFSSSNSAESHVSHRRSYSPTRQKKVTAGGSVFDGLFGRKSLKRSDKRKGKEKEVHANDHKKNYPTRDRNFNGETRKASGAGVGFFQNLKV